MLMILTTLPTAETRATERNRSFFLASDLAVAQQLLTNGSTLVHGIVVRHRDMADQLKTSTTPAPCLSVVRREGISPRDHDLSTLRSKQSNMSIRSLIDFPDLEKADSGGIVRVGIRPDGDGPLRLQVQ